MRKLILPLLFLVTVGAVAQQKAQYTQYMVNQYILNPAEGGTKEYIELKAGYRKQWLGMNGGPRSYYVSGHAFVGKKTSPGRIRMEDDRHHSIGGYAYSDKLGPMSHLSAYLSYGYNLRLTPSLKLSAAAFGGIQQYRIDVSQIEFAEDGDVWEGYSPTTIIPDATAGVWLYGNNFFFGTAIHQLLKGKVNAGTLSGGLGEGRLNFHYFTTAGLNAPLSTHINFIPSIMVKMAGTVKPSIDLNAKLRVNNLWWAGASFRVGDSFSVLGGVLIANKFDVSYSFDLTVSSLFPYNFGSHEVVVGYRIYKSGKVDCPEDFW